MANETVEEELLYPGYCCFINRDFGVLLAGVDDGGWEVFINGQSSKGESL